jgi:hypothetical protein
VYIRTHAIGKKKTGRTCLPKKSRASSIHEALLDDDTASALLAKLLRHGVRLPSDIGLIGSPDPVIVCVQNLQRKASHPSPTRDLSPKGLVAAIPPKVGGGALPLANEYIVLNQWR